MNMTEILELKRKHDEQELEYRLKVARYKNNEALINLCVHIISEQNKSSVMALFSGLEN